MCPHSGFRFGGTCERAPHSGFRFGGTSECTLVPVFLPGEHPPKPPFWKPPFLWSLLSTPQICKGKKQLASRELQELKMYLSVAGRLAVFSRLLGALSMVRKCWLRSYAERIWGEFFILARRIVGKLPANFSAKFDGEF